MAEDNSHSWVVDVNDADFQATVDQHSTERLVLVDFWAEWCAPCRALSPVLESLAAEYDGRFILLKANTETTQAAAGQFGVSGIPAVYAISSGEIVDSFQGALPEAEIRQWINRLLDGDPVAQAMELAESDPAAAEAELQRIAQETQQEASVLLALADLQIRIGKLDEAAVWIEQLESRGFLEPEGERIKARIALARTSSIDLAEAQKAHANAPDDLSVKHQFAQAQAGSAAFADALQTALEIVEADFGDHRELARQLMVQIFRVLPESDPLTLDYRRQLSMALH